MSAASANGFAMPCEPSRPFIGASLPDRLLICAEQSEMGRNFAGTPQACREAAALLNTPEVDDFAKGVVMEAAHQRGRWGSEHDAGKAPLDWFWLIGYLAQKAALAAIAGDAEKAKHHTISTAAALANWHLALTGADTSMRPGIAPPKVSPEALGFVDGMETSPSRMRRSLHRSHHGEGRNFVG